MAETDEIIVPRRRYDSVRVSIPGSLEGQAGYLGARLGWHGWHRPVSSYDPPVTFDRVGMLETFR